jgi:DNA-binding CsgD family transcriptional regulator/tetratricopeptide (TPR) repeat protein
VGAQLLEREADLRVLETLVAQASGGDGRVGLIEGPPGIGKTSLVSAAARLAAEAGMRCLSARGSPMERAFPFGVVRQLFEPVLAAGPAERSEMFAGPAGRAERLLSGAGGPAADGGGPFAVYHGLYWLTANLSGVGALALLVDDLQWGDPPSLEAVEYLGRRLEGLPVLLVVASRSHEPGFDRSVLDTLGREPAAREVVPRALSEAATAQMLRSRMSAAATDGFCRACHAATGGNPLLTAELATALAAEGLTGQTDDAAKVAEIGPEAVAAAVRLRLARLSKEARSLVEAACVLGDGVPLEDAAALAGLELPAAAAAATALAEADLLRAEETVAFVHPVVRAAVYAGLGPFGRRDAHVRAARLLAGAGRPAERVAAQVLRCPPAEDPDAVAVLRAAARRSLAEGATGLAVEYLQRALDEPPQAGQLPEVLAGLGTAEQLLNAPRATAHLREALALTEDPARRARIARRLGGALSWAGRPAEANSVFEQALADPSLDAAQVHSLEADLVTVGLFEPQLVPQARQRLRQFDPSTPPTDFDGHILLAYAAYDQVRTGTRKDTAVEWALRLLGAPAILAETGQAAFAVVGGVLLAADRLDEAERLAEDVTRAGEESGSVLLACGALWVEANVLHRRGALADAEACYSSAVDTAAARGFTTITNWAGSEYAIMLADRSDGPAALQVLRRLGLDGPLPDTVHFYEARLAAGIAKVACGQVQEGIDQIRAVGGRWEAIGARNPDLAPWRAHLAQALLLAGQREEARTLADEHAALARGWGANRPLARALRVQALATGGPNGTALLHESVALARDSPGRLELALSLVELGAAERRANQRTAAREPLEEGLSLAHQCGARALQDRALAELLAAGARPRRPPASGRDTLTPSELRIADLAGAGQTNRQIAQRLFITQKTVETHLAHAFRKLHIDSRAQIPAALARLANPGRSRGLFRRRRHLNQGAVRAGEEHAPPVTGLNRASLSHIGGPCRPGELPARGGVAEDDPLGLALAGDFGPGDVRADPDAVSLRADQRGPLGGGLGLLPHRRDG